MENIVWFDVIALALIFILGVKGIINGFIKESFGLIGLVGGIYIASHFAESAGIWIDNNLYAFDNKATLFLIGFIALLLVFWLSSLLVGQIITKLLDMSGLSGFDKIAGFFIGSAKIFLVFSILFATLSKISFAQEKISFYLDKSFMYPIFLETGKKIVSLDSSVVLKDPQEIVPVITNDSNDINASN
ncbi:MAG: CvpA family protein [Campylobacteraceae bacterium]|nr:CvpA family protein [Campylobacteraceae bacterium]